MNGRLENEMRIFRASDEVVKQLPSFAQEWYLSLKGSGKSASSCYDYIRKIRKFLEYISDDIADMNSDVITFDACESFFISCQTHKDNDGMEVTSSNSYMKAYWSVLNNFFQFMVQRKYIPYNFLNDIERVKQDDVAKIKKKRVKITKNDFNKIIAAAKDGSGYKQGLLQNRDVLIILLFMTTGLQKSTMSTVNLEDINIEDKTLEVVDAKNKASTYNLSEPVIKYLNGWLEDRKQIVTNPMENALLVKKDGTRLGDDSIYNIVKRCCYKGVGKKLSPNQLRVGFCEILYNKTHNLELVKEAIGHRDIHTTERYIRTKQNGREKATKLISSMLND